jgi:hypothetical protein
MVIRSDSNAVILITVKTLLYQRIGVPARLG